MGITCKDWFAGSDIYNEKQVQQIENLWFKLTFQNKQNISGVAYTPTL